MFVLKVKVTGVVFVCALLRRYEWMPCKISRHKNVQDCENKYSENKHSIA